MYNDYINIDVFVYNGDEFIILEFVILILIY